jgi:predicted DNA-binding transcriptional regulator AlpA
MKISIENSSGRFSAIVCAIHNPSNGVPMADQSATPWVRGVPACNLFGVSKSTFWRLTKEPDFPPPRYLTPTLKVWPKDELIAWRDARAAKLADTPRRLMPEPPKGRRTATAKKESRPTSLPATFVQRTT